MTGRTILVANRGEIALRIFRTAKRMQMRTVAVYSDADEGAPHVGAADVAVRIGPAPAAESYLRHDVLLETAERTGADLLHPGYGFLAEDHVLARMCEDAGLTFVGPPSAVLQAVGDKASARRLATEAGIPVLEGYAGEDQSSPVLREAAERIGYPLLVKPASGGGGKGMTVVRYEDELASALESARRIASASFGDDTLILECFVPSPRHIEVQIVADGHGNVVHLGDRDCSMQRRHQKIWEEAPAPNLGAEVRELLHESATGFGRHAGYQGAGTCEFVVSGGEVGFIEMNARLQVEHPVTEMVTGLDLVELQLVCATGGRLPFGQDEVRWSGHAIEVRVYAEDPSQGFVPQSGRIEHIRWPEDVRVEAGIEEGTAVPAEYDPLLAKLIVHGPDRRRALSEMRRALSETQILGVSTNLTFLSAVAAEGVVEKAEVTTDWIDEAMADGPWWNPAPGRELALAVAAAAEVERATARGDGDPWASMGPWRPSAAPGAAVALRHGDEEQYVTVTGDRPYRVGDLEVRRGPDGNGWIVSGEVCAAVRVEDRWLVWAGGAAHEVGVGPAERRSGEAATGHVASPLPGRVIAVRVAPDQEVVAGDELVVVEAMKMEHSIRSPMEATVRSLLCAVGDQVERGQALVDLVPAVSEP